MYEDIESKIRVIMPWRYFHLFQEDRYCLCNPNKSNSEWVGLSKIIWLQPKVVQPAYYFLLLVTKR